MLSLLFEYFFQGLVLCILLALGYLYLTRKEEKHGNNRRTQSGLATDSDFEEDQINDLETDKNAWTEDQTKRCEAIAKESGIHALQEMIHCNLNKWQNINVIFAVIGETGAGKSSFINAMLRQKAGEKGSARVGCTQTTLKRNEYQHPKHKSLSFWDLPGVGTSKFPKDTYLVDIRFKMYDFFIMVTSGSFTENELWLIKEIEKRGRKFYFVRTKIDLDILNDSTINPDDHDSKKLQGEIRDSIHTQLSKDGVSNKIIFLIDNNWNARRSIPCESYDFEILMERLIADVPKLKRQTLIFSLSAISLNLMNEKVKALKSRIKYVALAASMGSLVPIPGAGFSCEIGAIIHEVQLYKEQLQTDERSMKTLAEKMNINLNELCQNTNVKTHAIYAGASASQRLVIALCAELATSEAAESVLKGVVPILGNVISAMASIPICAFTLQKLLKRCEEEAMRVQNEFEKWSVTAADTSE
ncbi:interferon-inducible GTPase 1-like [Mya arenaria]|uniref:interferon-inducible GTPase 1-like n=1 Tax=Mya arenaria TaxID=6604 RepID=UPI0022E28B59|nr:interferon-inducible GTPase 1-like [Mya arenaria]XP_052789043.1 interferon-inducible GTPase 1-like [Mya arenaria]